MLVKQNGTFSSFMLWAIVIGEIDPHGVIRSELLNVIWMFCYEVNDEENIQCHAIETQSDDKQQSEAFLPKCYYEKNDFLIETSFLDWKVVSKNKRKGE